MTRRGNAERVLAGRVNDWPAEAQSLAGDVVALCDEADAVARVHAREVEVLRVNAAAVEARMVTAVDAARAALERAKAAEVEQERLRDRIRDLEFAAVNLSGEIVEVQEGRRVVQRDQRWVFLPGAGDSIRSFRKVVRIT